jgi:fluoroquinolone transport system permease protein
MMWSPLCASAALSVVLVAALTWSRPPELQQIIDIVRRSGFFLALGAPFLLEDPAASTIASSPTTLFERRCLRLGIGVGAVAPAWAAILGYAAVRMDGGGLPVGALTLEFVAILMVGFVLSAGSIARGYAGGPSGAVALFLLSWALPWMPNRWTLLGGAPGDRAWAAAHLRWAAAVAVALCLTIAFSLDPSRRGLRARFRHA